MKIHPAMTLSLAVSQPSLLQDIHKGILIIVGHLRNLMLEVLLDGIQDQALLDTVI